MSLDEFLKIADVPSTRTDLSKFENIKWLVQNLGIRNSQLAGFDRAFIALKTLYIQQMKVL